MHLTDEEAALLANELREMLRSRQADAIVDAIDESRRLGIEEEFQSTLGLVPPMQQGAASLEFKNLGTTRRRAPGGHEMLRISLDRIQQRCVALPAIAQALRRRLNTGSVVWKVDTEFVSADRVPEASLADLMPDAEKDLRQLFAKIEELIPDVVRNTEKGRPNR